VQCASANASKVVIDPNVRDLAWKEKVMSKSLMVWLIFIYSIYIWNIIF